MKTSENDVKYSSFYMGEMDKPRELYSKEGDNSSRFIGKSVPWEHTIALKGGIFGNCFSLGTVQEALWTFLFLNFVVQR